MKIPKEILFEDGRIVKCGEWAKLASGRIVVMTEEHKGYPESFWFDENGKNPKSRLIFFESDEIGFDIL